MKIEKVVVPTEKGYHFKGWFNPDNCIVRNGNSNGHIKPILYITKYNRTILYNGYNAYTDLSRADAIEWFITNGFGTEDIPNFLNDEFNKLEIK